MFQAEPRTRSQVLVHSPLQQGLRLFNRLLIRPRVIVLVHSPLQQGLRHSPLIC